MRIWHVGSARSPHAAGGISSIIWTLASAQAKAGHDVLVVVADRPDHTAAAGARRLGIMLLHIECTRLRFHPIMLSDKLRDERPDIVHLHSVFVPRLATLARTLLKWQIPYVITPHGGLTPQAMATGKKLRKTIYRRLVERARFNRSSAITLAGMGEESDVRKLVPKYKNLVQWIPNPVDFAPLAGFDWQPEPARRKLVYIGQLEVGRNGIEPLINIARHMQDAELHLYGDVDPRSHDALNDLKRTMTPNVFFHDAVTGADKARALSEATMYVHMTGGEEFPVPVTEAMSLGVPCAIQENLVIAPMFREQDLGLVVPAEAKAAATKIRWAMEHTERLKEWSNHTKVYAQLNLAPEKAAERYLRVYRKSLPMRKPSKLGEAVGFVANLIGAVSSFGLAE